MRTGALVLLDPLDDVRRRHLGLAAADLARLYVTCRPIPAAVQRRTVNAFGGSYNDNSSVISVNEWEEEGLGDLVRKNVVENVVLVHFGPPKIK